MYSRKASGITLFRNLTLILKKVFWINWLVQWVGSEFQKRHLIKNYQFSCYKNWMSNQLKNFSTRTIVSMKRELCYAFFLFDSKNIQVGFKITGALIVTILHNPGIFQLRFSYFISLPPKFIKQNFEITKVFMVEVFSKSRNDTVT